VLISSEIVRRILLVLAGIAAASLPAACSSSYSTDPDGGVDAAASESGPQADASPAGGDATTASDASTCDGGACATTLAKGLPVPTAITRDATSVYVALYGAALSDGGVGQGAVASCQIDSCANTFSVVINGVKQPDSLAANTSFIFVGSSAGGLLAYPRTALQMPLTITSDGIRSLLLTDTYLYWSTPTGISRVAYTDVMGTVENVVTQSFSGPGNFERLALSGTTLYYVVQGSYGVMADGTIESCDVSTAMSCAATRKVLAPMERNPTALVARTGSVFWLQSPSDTAGVIRTLAGGGATSVIGAGLRPVGLVDDGMDLVFIQSTRLDRLRSGALQTLLDDLDTPWGVLPMTDSYWITLRGSLTQPTGRLVRLPR
jgi:hypothetical protein